jgi:hypothetical protein
MFMGCLLQKYAMKYTEKEPEGTRQLLSDKIKVTES